MVALRIAAVTAILSLVTLQLAANAGAAMLPQGQIVGWGSTVVAPLEESAVFTTVAAGTYHSLALKSDGTVVAWGANVHSIYGSYIGKSNPPQGMTNAVAIACGGDSSVALSGGGKVTGWGYFGPTPNNP